MHDPEGSHAPKMVKAFIRVKDDVPTNRLVEDAPDVMYIEFEEGKELQQLLIYSQIFYVKPTDLVLSYILKEISLIEDITLINHSKETQQ